MKTKTITALVVATLLTVATIHTSGATTPPEDPHVKNVRNLWAAYKAEVDGAVKATKDAQSAKWIAIADAQTKVIRAFQTRLELLAELKFLVQQSQDVVLNDLQKGGNDKRLTDCIDPLAKLQAQAALADFRAVVATGIHASALTVNGSGGKADNLSHK